MKGLDGAVLGEQEESAFGIEVDGLSGERCSHEGEFDGATEHAGEGAGLFEKGLEGLICE